MNSLVGYGVSSESDSDGDVEDVNSAKAASVKDVGDTASTDKSTRNFLLESGSTSDESESEDEDPEPSSSPSRHSKPACSAAWQPTLPPPSLGVSSKLPPPSLHACFDSSVFANPFKAQADRKLSALQKHVPLTLQAKPSHIGGRKMCVSYRKDGRCRFGIKCKFAHDSDLQTPSDGHGAEETPVSDQAEAHGGSQNLQQEAKEEETGRQQVKKRKVGLSNTLTPPKRAMKQYAMQRDREKINMF